MSKLWPTNSHNPIPYKSINPHTVQLSILEQYQKTKIAMILLGLTHKLASIHYIISTYSSNPIPSTTKTATYIAWKEEEKRLHLLIRNGKCNAPRDPNRNSVKKQVHAHRRRKPRRHRPKLRKREGTIQKQNLNSAEFERRDYSATKACNFFFLPSFQLNQRGPFAVELWDPEKLDSAVVSGGGRRRNLGSAAVQNQSKSELNFPFSMWKWNVLCFEHFLFIYGIYIK